MVKLIQRNSETQEVIKSWEVIDTKIDLLRELGLSKIERSLRNGILENRWIRPQGSSYEYKWEEDDAEVIIEKTPTIEVKENKLRDIGLEDIYDKINTPNLKRSETSDTKKVLLFGDLHFNLQHQASINILMQISSEYEFDEVISGGDGVDFGELSHYDFLEDIDNNFRDEKLQYECFLFNLKKLQPRAKFIELYSNHFDDRAFKVSRSGDFKRYGMQDEAYKMFTSLNFKFDYRTKHSLEKYYPLNQNRIGFIHGVKHNDHVAKMTGLALGVSDIGFFHTHQVQTYTYTNETPDRSANRFYALPCMCKKDLKYRRNNPSRWSNGFCILNYDLKTDYYSLEYIIVENDMAIYRDKIYKG